VGLLDEYEEDFEIWKPSVRIPEVKEKHRRMHIGFVRLLIMSNYVLNKRANFWEIFSLSDSYFS
jgi:hypothetical protein